MDCDFFVHFPAIICAAGVLALFPILRYCTLPVPATYSLKTTQQIVNFLIVIIGHCFAILFKYCLGLTNEARTKCEYENSRLQKVHLELSTYAAQQSIWKLIKYYYRFGNPKKKVAALNILALLVLSGVTVILSSIFVLQIFRVDPKLIRTNGQLYSPGPTSTKGYVLSGNIDDDPCNISITLGNCTYDRAIEALSSQLIAQDPYQLSGFTFVPPNSTRGVPWDVFNSFQQLSKKSRFGDERRQICIPTLPKKTVTCTEDSTNSRASYQTEATVNGFEVITVTINPHAVDSIADSHVRVSFQNGTMTIAQSKNHSETDQTILSGAGIYADILSQLTNGVDHNSTSETFTTTCQISRNVSWNWVTLTYKNNLMTMDVSDEGCDISGIMNDSFTGITHLPYAIQGSTRLVNGVDGYSKYLNVDNLLVDSGSNVSLKANLTNYASAAGMTMLESILSQMYEIAQTSYTRQYNDSTPRTQITTLDSAHKYGFKINFTAISIVVLVLSVFLLLNVCAQAYLHLKALLDGNARTLVWQSLLKPIPLMEYSAGHPVLQTAAPNHNLP